MHDLCSTKSKNTALNSKGEEEKVKKCEGASKKNLNNTGGRCSVFLFFILILSLALHLCLQHLYF